MVLSARFKNNGIPSMDLNKTQKLTIKQLNLKIENNEYVFEKLNCLTCNSKDFQTLSEKSRYGVIMHVVICKNCGLVQTNPRMTKDSLYKFYENEYRKIDQGLESPNQEFFLKQYNHGKNIYNYIKQITGKPIKKKFVVEIGTGSGGILQFFKENDNKVLGLDIDREYIEFGKTKGLNLNVGTIEKISSLDKKPDLIIYSHVVEHLINPLEDLKKIRNYVNNNSLLYVEVPGIKFLEYSYNQDFLRYLHDAHTFHYTLTSLKNCMKKAGFDFIAGNEVINSLFKIGRIDENYENDYDLVIQYLQKLERNKMKKFNVNKFKFLIVKNLISILNLTNTTAIAESIISKKDNNRNN